MREVRRFCDLGRGLRLLLLLEDGPKSGEVRILGWLAGFLGHGFMLHRSGGRRHPVEIRIFSGAMRRSRAMLWPPAALLLAAAVVVLAAPPLRWRAHLVLLKTAGRIPDVTWAELGRMLTPGGPIYLEPLVASRNPYSAIVNPHRSREDVLAGGDAFRAHCSSCHGTDGAGASAPSLTEPALVHGGSDWAFHRAVTHGVPGGMPAQQLPERSVWQIVAYLQSLREAAARPDSIPAGGDPVAIRPVPAASLVGARADSADWLTYSGSYDGWRYSTLSQITPANAQRLRLLWIYQLRERDTRFETTPLAVDGVLFLTTPGNAVLALDAATGAPRWTYQRRLPERLSLCCGAVNRGLAILDTTLYLATLDAHLVALDARTGRVRWDVAAADASAGYSFTSAPLAVRDLVVIGNAGGEFPTRGFIDAYDAGSGARRWRFYTIPGPGEPGSETWSGRSAETGGAPAWLTGSYDPELDLLYWGTGNPNPDFDGDGRLGDNLYASSVVALDAATGARRWHFQFTPHDEHDWDAAQIPVLVTEPGPAGRRLLLSANRNGFYYVLDRATGRFLTGRPFAEQTWALGLDSNGRPRPRPGIAPTPGGTLLTPGWVGATSWWSPTYSPRTGRVYVATFTRSDLYFKGADPSDTGRFRLGGGHRSIVASSGRLSIRALEAATGVLRWEHPVFDTIPAQSMDVGGLLSTAGDVVFGGGDDLLLALDARDGRRLWTFRAGSGVHAAPITYLVGGRQQLTVAVGRALLTFGLDQPGDSAR